MIDKVSATNRKRVRSKDRQTDRDKGGREREQERVREIRDIVCARKIDRETKTDTGRELWRECVCVCV